MLEITQLLVQEVDEGREEGGGGGGGEEGMAVEKVGKK